MKIPLIIAILFYAVAIIPSCKKDSPENESKQTSAKIRTRWAIDSIKVNQRLNGVSSSETLVGTADDFMEFRDDGRVRTHFRDNDDYSSYTVTSATVITINGDSGYIQELTENKFTLYAKAEAGSIGFLETTYYLSK